MAESLKCIVKGNAHRRRGERSVNLSRADVATRDASRVEWIVLSPRHNRAEFTNSRSNPERVEAADHLPMIRAPDSTESPRSSTQSTRFEDDTLTDRGTGRSLGFGRSDTILMMFYLENTLPFLFPLYQPSILDGGRAWLLELMVSSPVVRQATLCQSSYYLSLARGTANHNTAWETVLAQTAEAFNVLGLSLQYIRDPGIAEHIHGAVRILTSIMQLQRFEIAISSFRNCEAHVGAAVALFSELLGCGSDSESAEPYERFQGILSKLEPQHQDVSSQHAGVPSAEQTAFRFSSALLILDDIIASTVLQQRPRLYDSHRSLLCGDNLTGPAIDLREVTGCENWAMQQIGEIAVLDAWKQECIRAGNLNVMQLVQQATVIQESLATHLAELASRTKSTTNDGIQQLLGFSGANTHSRTGNSDSQGALVTRIWGSAAHIYLSVVVSGWQPASSEIRSHVRKIQDAFADNAFHPALLRTVAWPFCVAGCLSEPDLHCNFRGAVVNLPQPGTFGTVRKALEIMENVWRHQTAGTAFNIDLAACFRLHDERILLV